MSKPARATKTDEPPKRRSDITASFAYFAAEKKSREAARELTAALSKISHNTVAALRRGDRLPALIPDTC